MSVRSFPSLASVVSFLCSFGFFPPSFHSSSITNLTKSFHIIRSEWTPRNKCNRGGTRRVEWEWAFGWFISHSNLLYTLFVGLAHMRSFIHNARVKITMWVKWTIGSEPMHVERTNSMEERDTTERWNRTLYSANPSWVLRLVLDGTVNH